VQKQGPGLGRVLVMAGFTLSVFGLLLFLWLSFGGASPLKPREYRVQVEFAEAANLANEADVRISGINVGRVKELDSKERPAVTVATLAIDERYAPIPEDSRAMLRQKTLLGETYVELTPGTRGADEVDDGGRLDPGQVAETVELDEIFRTFDAPTREAFRRWVTELARTTKGGGGSDVNEAFGQLPGFATGASDVLTVLDRRREALGRLVRNTGVVFGALNERDGQLRELIVNSSRLFETTAARDEAIAETIEIFPTFLDESRATVVRLEQFSRDTAPLVRELRPVARELGPTLRGLGALAPDLTDLFGDLEALNATAPRTLPDAQRFIEGATPVLAQLHPFLQELNPIVSYLNYMSPHVADFITNAGATFAIKRPARGLPNHFLRQLALAGPGSLAFSREAGPNERANAYHESNAYLRMRALGIVESFDCSNAGGEKRDPTEGSPPCFVKSPSMWDRGLFPTIERGEFRREPPPQGNEGLRPADPDRPAAGR
jgi:phospholipid/cholesterol/gamma-HCH transport system substrate-binding protein